jgi:hypothetical protein
MASGDALGSAGAAAVASGTPLMHSLVGATATGPGLEFDVGRARNNWGVFINTTGSPTSVSVSLQGSPDGGTTWYTITGAGSAAGYAAVTSLPLTHIRLYLGTLSGGASPAVDAWICGY